MKNVLARRSNVGHLYTRRDERATMVHSFSLALPYTMMIPFSRGVLPLPSQCIGACQKPPSPIAQEENFLVVSQAAEHTCKANCTSYRANRYTSSLSLSASEAAPMIWRPSNTMSLADSRRSAGDGGGAGRVANGAAEIADGFLARETAAATLDLDVCGRAPILCKRLL
jgi:hypothetical protein